MRTATIEIVGLTPYSQSRALTSEKERSETYDDFDRRTWPEHMHVDADSKTFIPAVALLQGIAAAASYLAKGGELKKKGNSTWAQNFLCGVAVARGPELQSGPARPERIFCNADGKRGSGTRVWRTFPVFDQWGATVLVHVLDDTIPDEVFDRVVKAFGLFIGIGRYRPQNGGYLGRFTVKSLKMETAS